MRHVGIHWPSNAGGEHPSVEYILGMPGIRQGACLITAESARYWYRQLRGTCPLVVWRAIPRHDRLPAHLGWEPNRVADECLNLWDEQPHGGAPEWFLPLNELRFEKEAGEPFPGYARTAERLGQLRLQLRRKLAQRYPDATVRLVFPAWVPGDDLEHADEWLGEALQWDAVCLHAYGAAGEIGARYAAYRQRLGPDVPIFVGEWNANHTGADERQSLLVLDAIASGDPAFLGATYYIWETRNAGEHDLSIWGNPDRLALFMDPPVVATVPAPAPTPEPEPAMPETLSRAQIVDVVQAVADAVGIPRLLLFACGCAESNLGQFSRRPADFDDAAEFWPDVSMGAFHQTVRYAPEYLRWCAVDAPGHDPNAFPGLDVVEAVAAHYWDVEHAAQVAASQLKGKFHPGEPDAIFRALCRYNWPAGDGRPYSDAHAANYRRGIADATEILTADVPTEPSEPVFDPNHPAHPQEETFDCSQESLEWGFWAYGRTTSDDWLESTMLAEGVMSREWGLMDASGAGLAAFVRRHYGELGYTAESADPVTFDAVAAEAGRYPLLIGGRAWYHWSGVRGYDAAADVLLLANPADGHKGVGQTLSRAQWAALGPFSLVRVRHESTAVAQPPAEPDELSALRARNAELEAERAALIEGLAVAADDHGDAIQRALDAIRQIRAERVGPRPAA